MAASAASIIAMAGNKIFMPKNTQFIDDEKFFSAKEALKWGFIDEILNYETKPLEKKEAIENKGKLFMDTKAIELTDKVLKQREQRLVAYTNAMNKAFRNGGKQ